jgi:ATP-dependent helicase HrpB
MRRSSRRLTEGARWCSPRPVAESSITIDGVRIVIDSGLVRQPVYEPSTGITRLETIRASQASADQRAGRAGRTAPGIAVRLWRAEQTKALPAFSTPQVLASDLSAMVLDCLAWGVRDPRDLRFIDPPPEARRSPRPGCCLKVLARSMPMAA